MKILLLVSLLLVAEAGVSQNYLLSIDSLAKDFILKQMEKVGISESDDCQKLDSLNESPLRDDFPRRVEYYCRKESDNISVEVAIYEGVTGYFISIWGGEDTNTVSCEALLGETLIYLKVIVLYPDSKRQMTTETVRYDRRRGTKVEIWSQRGVTVLEESFFGPVFVENMEPKEFLVEEVFLRKLKYLFSGRASAQF